MLLPVALENPIGHAPDPDRQMRCARRRPSTETKSDLASGRCELLPDAEPKDGNGACLRVADRFQVDPGEAWGREADAVAEQDGQYIHLDLVDEPPLQALASDVGAEDLEVLAACSLQGGGDRFPDVTGEVRDIRVRRLRWPMGEDEHGSIEGVAFAPRFCPPIVVGLHPLACLDCSPADEHGAGSRRGLLLPRRVIRHEVEDPVLRVTGTGDEAIQRHRPVYDDLAVSGARIAHSVPPTTLPGLSSRAANNDVTRARILSSVRPRSVPEARAGARA